MYDTRICYKETGNICPVLIDICVDRFCNKGSCYIRSAPGKCLNCAVCACTVESRDYCTLAFAEFFRKELVGLLSFQITVLVKTNHRSRIYKIISKICSHDLTIKELSSGCRILDSCLCTEILLNLLELILKGKRQAKTFDNLIISLFDRFQLIGKILSLGSCIIASVKHIRYLDVFVKSLSRS